MSDTQQKYLTNSEQAAANFVKDVREHAATVPLDSGLYRHVECRKPGTGMYAFRVITWPGALCISGDMGSYVFRRLEDMFEFFRSDKGRVNLSYWREKLVAADADGAMKFDPDKFESNVKRVFDEWLEERSLDSEDIAELRQRVEDDVLSRAHDGEQQAIGAALDFRHNRNEVFADFWDMNHRDYTYQFVWCCHAIVWAIQQYDTRKQLQAVQP